MTKPQNKLYYYNALFITKGYSNVRDSIQSTNKVVMSKTVTCSKGHVRLLLAAARNTPDFSISDNFFFGVQALPAYYDRTLYRNFLKTWGTVSIY